MDEAYSWLKVYQYCSGYVSGVVALKIISKMWGGSARAQACLVEEHVFPVPTLSRKIFKVTILIYTMF